MVCCTTYAQSHHMDHLIRRRINRSKPQFSKALLDQPSNPCPPFLWSAPCANPIHSLFERRGRGSDPTLCLPAYGREPFGRHGVCVARSFSLCVVRAYSFSTNICFCAHQPPLPVQTTAQRPGRKARANEKAVISKRYGESATIRWGRCSRVVSRSAILRRIRNPMRRCRLT